MKSDIWSDIELWKCSKPGGWLDEGTKNEEEKFGQVLEVSKKWYDYIHLERLQTDLAKETMAETIHQLLEQIEQEPEAMKWQRELVRVQDLMDEKARLQLQKEEDYIRIDQDICDVILHEI